MKRVIHLSDRAGGGHARKILSVLVIGFAELLGPMVGAAQTAPTIAQQPLIQQPVVPPNIMLMLDDSGSMTWDIMPDWSYLPAPNWATLQNNWNEFDNNSVLPLINSSINGVYYNPTVTYAPPPSAGGGSYAQSSFSNAPVNGFVTNGSSVDLSSYRGIYDSNDTSYMASSVQYSISVPIVGATAYTPGNCPVNANAGNSSKYPGYCWSNILPSKTTFFDTTNDAYYSRCNSVSDVYNATNNSCTPGISFFTYATTDSTGAFTRYYVSENSGDCVSVGLTSNCVAASDASGAAAPAGVAAGANIANWFSYYHTRILAAKSGLMAGFANLPTTFRFGFGSINNDNSSSQILPNRVTSGSNLLAPVQVFGDGSAGTQKAAFWNWVATINPSGGTPLRLGLQSVGMYYQTSQPWQTMQGDPTSSTNAPLACRASYAILTTDGFWNGSTPAGVGNADGMAGPTITGPNVAPYTYTPAAPFSGGDPSPSTTPSLADVAMQYWETDLQPTMANEVPPSSGDPAFWQHMTTFTMGMGFDPVGISPAGTSIDSIFNWAHGGTPISNFSWPQPASNSENNIADLVHAAVNGHGAYFSAKDPQAFSSGIKEAVKRIEERVGTGASLAANSTQLNTGTVVYQANYYTGKWKGDLKALSVNSVTGSIAAAPTWQAANLMPAAASRTIETWNGTGFVSFANDSTGAPPALSSAQAMALGGGSSGSAAAEAALVNYLRGDPSQEQRNGGAFRNRDTSLGDVVNSQPVYSGVPDVNEFSNQTFFGSDSFMAWAAGPVTGGDSPASTRQPLIFVAANDGMLHGFNATTGAEVYAYLPGAVITAGLKNLSDPAYGGTGPAHQYYNDGQLTIADAYLPTLAQINGSSWHTILVGTTGRGLAMAVYALDVTDPTNIQPLWERSAGDTLSGSNYIGQMVGKPVIAQTNSTTTGSTWSVLMGNGYNSAAGVSALLQFDLATGTLSVHPTDGATGNGLSGPVTWMDTPANGVSDVAYAGDLLGRVWSFNLNDTTGAKPSLTSTGTLLFTTQATEPGGANQPITAGLLAGMDPAGNVWVFFGTGEYLNSNDLKDLSTQSWYGLMARQCTTKKNVTTCAPLSAPITLSQLVQRTITAQTSGSGSSLPARTVSAATANDMSGKLGWYLNLLQPSAAGTPNQGERMVDVNQFQGSLLVGATRIPPTSSSDPCQPSGNGWIMALDAFSGTAPQSNFFDVNRDGYIDAADSVGGNVAAGIGFSSLPNAPIFVSNIMEVSFDNGTTTSVGTGTTAGAVLRVDWRELTGQ